MATRKSTQNRTDLILDEGGLTPQQRVFCHEYVRTHNKTQSYAKAFGVSVEVAQVNAHKLLLTPHIRSELEQMEAEKLALVKEQTGVTIVNTVREIAKIAFYDVRNLFAPDGSPKPINELDDITAAAIVGIEVTEIWQGKGEDRVFVGLNKKYKLESRAKGLDMLMKHLNGYKEHQETQTNALVELLSGMRRSALPVVQEVERDDSL